MGTVSGIAAAVEQVRKHLGGPPGSALPPVRVLAASAGVSHPTMLRALHLLAGQGLLVVRQGRRCTISADPAAAGALAQSPAAAITARPQRHDEIRWQILRDINAGLYQPGEPLPIPKEMCNRYGVCHRTLSTALQRLVEQGLIERQRRRYRLLQPRVARPGSTIMLFARGDESGSLAFYAPGEQERFRTLERECAQRGLRLHVARCFFRGLQMLYQGEEQGLVGALRPDDESILGFMVWAGDLAERVHDLLPAVLPKYGRPIAVLNSWRPRPGRVVHASGAITRHFAYATGITPGRDVGRYLFSLGHTRIAYISTHSDMEWSQNRYAGLCAAMAECDPGCVVRQFAVPFEFEQVTVVESSAAVSRSLRAAATMALRGVTTLAARREALLIRERELLRSLRDREILRARVARLLGQAAGVAEATVWVGDNDGTALDALDYLRAHGRRVPEDVSVIGFDDEIDASLRGLTSYNFNGSAAVRAALQHLTDPFHGPASVGPGAPFEVPGFVTVRQTTAGARQGG